MAAPLVRVVWGRRWSPPAAVPGQGPGGTGVEDRKKKLAGLGGCSSEEKKK